MPSRTNLNGRRPTFDALESMVLMSASPASIHHPRAMVAHVAPLAPTPGRASEVVAATAGRIRESLARLGVPAPASGDLFLKGAIRVAGRQTPSTLTLKGSGSLPGLGKVNLVMTASLDGSIGYLTISTARKGKVFLSLYSYEEAQPDDLDNSGDPASSSDSGDPTSSSDSGDPTSSSDSGDPTSSSDSGDPTSSSDPASPSNSVYFSVDGGTKRFADATGEGDLTLATTRIRGNKVKGILFFSS